MINNVRQLKEGVHVIDISNSIVEPFRHQRHWTIKKPVNSDETNKTSTSIGPAKTTNENVSEGV